MQRQDKLDSGVDERLLHFVINDGSLGTAFHLPIHLASGNKYLLLLEELHTSRGSTNSVVLPQLRVVAL